MSDTNSNYVPPAAPEKVSGDVSARAPGKASSATERISAQAGYIIAQGGGVIWNLADLWEGEILLPNFVSKKTDGYYLDLSVLEKNPRAFYEFADRTFSSGAYLFKLDYPAFSKIVHEPEKALEIKTELESKGVPPELRFATDIIRISEERRPLYRSVKVSPTFSDAKYFFEPLYVDRPVTKVDASGLEVATMEQVRAKLDFDEFVAHLWNRGVRYGLIESDIRALIDADPPKVWWETVARQSDAIPGTDATTQELSDRLHQDKAPLILEWGKIDLRHWKNRFPQVNDGEKLLEKIPRKMGLAGMNVGGFPIEPEIPKDFNLAAIAGSGTKIEESGGRTYLVSAMNGFIDIDVRTSTISVSERIIHREGANMRQTGSLDLEGEHFEEHGEVDNGIEISGHSMHFKSYVAGTIYSNSWTVVTEGNVSGAIYSKGEAVNLKGKAIQNGRVECRNGEVTANLAINSVIIAKKVHVKHARNCVIIADEIVVDQSDGSALAASRTVRVKVSDVDAKGEATVITMELPDLNELAAPLNEVRKALKKKEEDLANLHLARQSLQKEITALSSEELVKKYSEQAKKVKEYQDAGKALTPEQSSLFEILKAAVRPKLLVIHEKRKKIAEFDAAISALDAQISPLVMLKQEHEQSLLKSVEGISAVVENVFWETVLRTRLPKKPAVVEGNGLRPKEKETDPKKLVAKKLADYETETELRKESFDRGVGTDRKADVKSWSIEWTYLKNQKDV